MSATATELKILADAAAWIKQSERRRAAFLADMQSIIDALAPVDDAAHVETVGRAVEITKSLIRTISKQPADPTRSTLPGEL